MFTTSVPHELILYHIFQHNELTNIKIRNKPGQRTLVCKIRVNCTLYRLMLCPVYYIPLAVAHLTGNDLWSSLFPCHRNRRHGWRV